MKVKITKLLLKTHCDYCNRGIPLWQRLTTKLTKKTSTFDGERSRFAYLTALDEHNTLHRDGNNF